MDSQQPITNWPRPVRSAILSLRNDLSAAYGYSKLVERVEPATEQQAKCLEESRRHLRRIVDTTDRLNKLMRWSQEPVWRPKVEVVELGPLVDEVVAGLRVQYPDSSWPVRMDLPPPTVLVNRDALTLLMEKVTRCVWQALGSDTPAIWLTEGSVTSSAEHWVVIVGADRLEAAVNPENLVPMTDDRVASPYLLEIAVASRQVEANGGRVLCFRERVPGAVIALPRAEQPG